MLEASQPTYQLKIEELRQKMSDSYSSSASDQSSSSIADIASNLDTLLKDYNDRCKGLLPEITLSIGGKQTTYCLDKGTTLEDLLRLANIAKGNISRVFLGGLTLVKDYKIKLKPFDKVIVVLNSYNN